MGLLSFFRNTQKTSAQTAKERLQIVIAHERSQRGHEFLPKMQQELLAVIRKYIPIDDNDVKLNVESDGNCEVLELNVTLPGPERSGE